VCLDEGEKDSKKILQSVTEALLSFVCHDEGDRIACKIMVLKTLIMNNINYVIISLLNNDYFYLNNYVLCTSFYLVFYSEGGPDCLMDKKEAIQHCLNTSFSKYMPNGEPSLSSLPAFKFEEDQCKYVS